MKEAIVLLNMGGPSNLEEVEVFLKNMFNDENILNLPKPFRKLLSLIITKSRLKEAQSNYKLLGGRSPIIKYTQNLTKKLKLKTGIDTFYIMRYTPPFAKDVLKDLISYDKIYAISLYPHYSVTTTKSSFDDLYREAKKLNIQDKIVPIKTYYNDEMYNKIIVKKIKEALKNDNASDFDLIFSAHSLPQKVIKKGDVYQKHIKLNRFFVLKELLKENIIFNKTHLAYQSKLGPMKWLEPSLEDKLKTIKNKKIIIYPLSFTIDNSETEFELDIEYKNIAKNLGYEDIRVAKCPNDDDKFVDFLEYLINKNKG